MPSESRILQGPVPDPVPLIPDALEQHIAKGLGNIKEAFTARSNKVVPAGAFKVPDKVDYGTQCRGLCIKTLTSTSMRLQRKLLDIWELNFKPDAIKDDVVFVYEIYNKQRVSEIGFYALCSASCRYGRHPAHQQFLRLNAQKVPGGPIPNYSGLVLQPDRKPFVEPQISLHHSSFNRFLAGAEGELNIVGEDVLSAKIVKGFPPKDGRVIIRILDHVFNSKDDGMVIQEWLIRDVKGLPLCEFSGDNLEEDSAEVLAVEPGPEPITDFAAEMLELADVPADVRADFLWFLNDEIADNDSGPEQAAVDQPVQEDLDQGVEGEGEDIDAADMVLYEDLLGPGGEFDMEEPPEPTSSSSGNAEPPMGSADPPGDLQEAPLQEALLEWRLKIEDEERWPNEVLDMDSDSGKKVIGRLHKVWGRTFKAVCRKHSQCSLIVNIAWFSCEPAAKYVCLQWLSLAKSTSENQHWSQAQLLRDQAKASKAQPKAG